MHVLKWVSPFRPTVFLHNGINFVGQFFNSGVRGILLPNFITFFSEECGFSGKVRSYFRISGSTLSASTRWSSVDVDGCPQRSKSLTRSRPSLKSFYHLLTFFCGLVELPKAFRNILNVSAAEISCHKQNLMELLCSIKSDIVKIEKCNLDRLVNTSVNILLTMTLT